MTTTERWLNSAGKVNPFCAVVVPSLTPESYNRRSSCSRARNVVAPSLTPESYNLAHRGAAPSKVVALCLLWSTLRLVVAFRGESRCCNKVVPQGTNRTQGPSLLGPFCFSGYFAEVFSAVRRRNDQDAGTQAVRHSIRFGTPWVFLVSVNQAKEVVESAQIQCSCFVFSALVLLVMGRVCSIPVWLARV